MITEAAQGQSLVGGTVGAIMNVSGGEGQASSETKETAGSAGEQNTNQVRPPEATKAAGAVAPEKPAAEGAEQVTDTPTYQPNFKFKVLGKEHEFDDFLKGVVKDAETEKKLRDLYEKAYGIEPVKADRQTLKTELSQAKEKIAQTDSALEMLGSYVRQGDFDSFFEALRIPKQAIIQYAIEVAKRAQNPEAQAAYEQARQARLAQMQIERESGSLEERHQELAVAQREFELNQMLTKPDTIALAQAYDAGIGQPGAFRDYVIRIGQGYAAAGQDISAEQAVAEAIRTLRAVNPNFGTAGGATPSVEQPAAAGPRVVAPNTKPVIPNIQGRGTSAVRSTIKTLEDIKKRGKELEAMQG